MRLTGTYIYVGALVLSGCGTVGKVILPCPTIPPQIEACADLPEVAEQRIPLEVILDEESVRRQYRNCQDELHAWVDAWANCAER